MENYRGKNLTLKNAPARPCAGLREHCSKTVIPDVLQGTAPKGSVPFRTCGSTGFLKCSFKAARGRVGAFFKVRFFCTINFQKFQ